MLVAELSTSSNDSSPVIRRDGLEMFLTSDRPGTLGGLDLWVSTRATTANLWSEPIDLGPFVNTAVMDATSTLSFHGTELYFSSNRPGGIRKPRPLSDHPLEARRDRVSVQFQCCPEGEISRGGQGLKAKTAETQLQL